MLFIAIIGFLVFLLAIFSTLSTRQSGGGWKFLATIALLSAIVTVYGVVKLPYWSFNQTAASSKKASSTSESASSSSESLKFGSSEAVFTKDKEKREAATLKLKEASILKQLKENYKELGKVSFDKSSKTFTITPTGKKYVKSLKIIKAHPTENQKAITTITSNFESLSKSMKKNLAAGYTVRLLQPDTTDTTLLSFKDGKTITNNLAK
ncbi:hypothetical protein [Lactiplantibacillus plajomi]|uniref:DUF308 domain-containing protein n=1 Tax=Lactiplantibacillus plajomi TaxID=1457217 RepID=A0ABV6JZW6_9LACO|nr:hypothetical protein [Lactiplantibacillus plajomi]